MMKATFLFSMALERSGGAPGLNRCRNAVIHSRSNRIIG